MIATIERVRRRDPAGRPVGASSAGPTAKMMSSSGRSWASAAAAASAGGAWSRGTTNRPTCSRPERLEAELELGHDAEVAAAAAQRPEELGIAVRSGLDDLAVGA